MAIDRGFGTAVEAGPIFITISDGDRGDITVSESGTVWTVSDTLTAYASATQGILADSAVQPLDSVTLADVIVDSLHITGGTATEGLISWNATDGTADLVLKGENVTLQIGQEQVVRVTNQTGTALSEGQVVYVIGSTGNHLDVGLAQANSEVTSSKTLAIVTEPIANNQSGFATVLGLVRDLNTLSFAEGAALWLSPTVAGGITSTRPTAPNNSVFLGWCIRQHASVGSIYVNIQNGYELNELHDMLITSVGNNDSLFYDSTSLVWKNKTPTDARTALGLGSIATQNNSSVDIIGGTVNGTSIGATTKSTGAFTSLLANTLGIEPNISNGGTVTQLTSRTTPVTLNKISGAITMFTAVGSTTAATFSVNNTFVGLNDVIIVSQKSGTNLYDLMVTTVAAGSFNITFRTTGGTASDAPVINFVVIKSSIN